MLKRSSGDKNLPISQPKSTHPKSKIQNRMTAQQNTHRQQFPALANKAYFNYGGQGPLPETALAAIYESYKVVQENGPFSGQVNRWVQQESALTRDAIASELGVTSQTITLTEDVTVGCNIALWGIDWQAGDEILLSDCEHPGIVAAIQELQRRFNLTVTVFPLRETLNGGDVIALIRGYLKPRTRILVISHILWNTGQVLPLKEIMQCCRSWTSSQQLQKSLRVLVDAAQSVGVLPLNLAEIGADFYAFTGHKWWCGPEGLGGLYVSSEAMADLAPTFVGWRGILTDKTAKPTGWKPDAQRYEIATSAIPLYAGLRNAIALHHQWGTTAERYQRICQLSGYLWQRLSELPQIHCLRTAPPEAGLVSFQLKTGQSHQQLVDLLEKQGCMVRTILDPDCVRACVHYFTLESELDRLVDAIVQSF